MCLPNMYTSFRIRHRFAFVVDGKKTNEKMAKLKVPERF